MIKRFGRLKVKAFWLLFSLVDTGGTEEWHIPAWVQRTQYSDRKSVLNCVQRGGQFWMLLGMLNRIKSFLMTQTTGLSRYLSRSARLFGLCIVKNVFATLYRKAHTRFFFCF